MTKEKKIMLGLIIFFATALIGVGTYAYYLKNNEPEKKETEIKEIEEDEEVIKISPEKIPTREEETKNEKLIIKMEEVCISDCETSLKDVVINNKKFKIDVNLKMQGKDTLKINKEEISFDEQNLKFIAIMNDEFFVIGLNYIAPEEIYTLKVYDLELNLKNTFYSYGHLEGEYDYDKNIFNNNKNIYYYTCEQILDDYDKQTLTTYELTFSGGKVLKRTINVEHDVHCAGEL